MTDRFSAIIARPNRDNLPLDIQGSYMRSDALAAMRQLGDIKAETLRLTDVTDSSTIYVGGTLVSLWQCNMVAARYTADGTATSLNDDWSGEIDTRRGVLETVHVERGLL